MAKCSLGSFVSRLTIHILIFEEGEHVTTQLFGSPRLPHAIPWLLHRLCTTLGVLSPSPAFLVNLEVTQLLSEHDSVQLNTRLLHKLANTATSPLLAGQCSFGRLPCFRIVGSHGRTERQSASSSADVLDRPTCVARLDQDSL